MKSKPLIKYFLYLFVLVSFQKANAQMKTYVLESKTDKADFNYKAFEYFDTLSPAQIRFAFNPVKGSFTVYTFIATYTGLSFTNTEKEFHDILLIKVNEKQEIVDAYQYTLEWAEPPLSIDFYKATKKGMILKNGINLKPMKFKSATFSVHERDTLNEDGIIQL